MSPGAQPVRVGDGPETQATLQSLGDGDYTFRVIQVNVLCPSEAATRSFKVDTQPPAAPAITVRPPFPASGVITFGWATEPGAFSRWQVIGPGPDHRPDRLAAEQRLDHRPGRRRLQLPGAPGRPAGNASAMTSGAVHGQHAARAGRAPSGPSIEPEFLLPTQNASAAPQGRRPSPTRRPVLRWRKGPRGTRLYNVQIFKVSSCKRRARRRPSRRSTRASRAAASSARPRPR